MKDIRVYKVRMSKREPTNSVLSVDDVLNDINDWLTEENGENDETGDNLGELCGEEEIDSHPSLSEDAQRKNSNLKNLKKLQKGRSGIPSELFDTQNRDFF